MSQRVIYKYDITDINQTLTVPGKPRPLKAGTQGDTTAIWIELTEDGEDHTILLKVIMTGSASDPL